MCFTGSTQTKTKWGMILKWVLNYLSTTLVFTRHVQEARQASSSPASSPEGPTSTTSTWASSSHTTRVTPLLAPQFLFLFHVIFYRCAVRATDAPWDTVSQRQPLGRCPQDWSWKPAPTGARWPLTPKRKTTQLSVCRIWEGTSQNGGGRKFRELQGRAYIWDKYRKAYFIFFNKRKEMDEHGCEHGKHFHDIWCRYLSFYS